MKLTAGYAFQLFYWNYVIGVLLASVLWGLTLGTVGGGDLSFFNNLRQADDMHLLREMPLMAHLLWL
jgi:glucose uptake protein